VLGVWAVGDAEAERSGEKGVGEAGYERESEAGRLGSQGERGEAGCAGRYPDLCHKNTVPTRKNSPTDLRHNPGKDFSGILAIKNHKGLYGSPARRMMREEKGLRGLARIVWSPRVKVPS